MLLADTQTGGTSSLYSLALFVVLGLAIYFLMLRPQSRRRKAAATMQSEIGPGDEVQTIGGLFGTVTEVSADAITIEAAPGVELRFVRGAIARIVTQVHADEPEADDADDADDDNADAARTIEKG